jgi:hypothetical protein
VKSEKVKRVVKKQDEMVNNRKGLVTSMLVFSPIYKPD